MDEYFIHKYRNAYRVNNIIHGPFSYMLVLQKRDKNRSMITTMIIDNILLTGVALTSVKGEKLRRKDTFKMI